MSEWSDEDSEQDDYGDDDVTETIPCPACGVEVYEDAEQCPACGQYIVPANNALAGRPVWWIVLGLLGAAAVLWVFVLKPF